MRSDGDRWISLSGWLWGRRRRNINYSAVPAVRLGGFDAVHVLAELQQPRELRRQTNPDDDGARSWLPIDGGATTRLIYLAPERRGMANFLVAHVPDGVVPFSFQTDT